jgi:hypothetical protein
VKDWSRPLSGSISGKWSAFCFGVGVALITHGERMSKEG